VLTCWWQRESNNIILLLHGTTRLSGYLRRFVSVQDHAETQLRWSSTIAVIAIYTQRPQLNALEPTAKFLSGTNHHAFVALSHAIIVSVHEEGMVQLGILELTNQKRQCSQCRKVAGKLRN